MTHHFGPTADHRADPTIQDTGLVNILAQKLREQHAAGQTYGALMSDYLQSPLRDANMDRAYRKAFDQVIKPDVV